MLGTMLSMEYIEIKTQSVPLTLSQLDEKVKSASKTLRGMEYMQSSCFLHQFLEDAWELSKWRWGTNRYLQRNKNTGTQARQHNMWLNWSIWDIKSPKDEVNNIMCRLALRGQRVVRDQIFKDHVRLAKGLNV